MPCIEDVLGTPVTLATACRCLRIDPPLRPGETVTWMRVDPATGTGINAAVYCFDPARADEPYGLSVGAYDESRLRGPNGEDHGTARTLVASLDFVWERRTGDALGSPENPGDRTLKLAKADLGVGLAEEDDRTLEAVLSEIGYLLASWPAVREPLPAEETIESDSD